MIDNNSSDGSVEMLKENFGDKIKLIINKENKGFGSANNQGAKTAKGDYLFFLNSDTIIKSNILIELDEFINKNQDVGVVAPKLLLENGNEQPFAFGDYPRVLNIILEKFKSPSVYKNIPFEVEWVSGAALIIKKNLFNKIGGFDENFFMYFEDIDLCKRVKDLDYKIMVNPRISITHLCGNSIKFFKKRKNYYYKSQDYFYNKYYGLLGACLMKLLRLPHKVIISFFNK